MMARLPMHQVIYDDLAARIASGDLAPETKLPGESELAEQFGVSRMTVRQALGRLQDDRLVTRRQGTGTFVAASARPMRRLNRLAPFREEFGVGEASVETEIKHREVLPPPEHVRRALGLKERAATVHMVRVRHIDDHPASVQESWVPYALVPALAREDLVNGSMYTTLRQHGVELGFAEQEMSAAIVEGQEAAWLQVSAGSPVMLITRITFTPASVAVEYAQSRTLPSFPVHVRLEA